MIGNSGALSSYRWYVPGVTVPIAPGSATDEMLPFAGLHEVIGEKPQGFLSKLTEKKQLNKKMGYNFARHCVGTGLYRLV